MAELPEKAKQLLGEKTFVHLATLMPDGSPQVSPVWVDTEGDLIVVNTAEGRAKPRNMRKDGRVAISATHPENPYVSVLVRGRVTDITTEDADQHIDALAKKYMGLDEYPLRRPDEVRLKVYITPESVFVMDPDG